MVASICMVQPPDVVYGKADYPRGTTARVNRAREFLDATRDGAVTDMVKVRKLTKNVITFYGYPSAEVILQIKDLFEIKPVLRPFFATKSRRFLQFSAKTCKKTTEKTGFSRPVLSKRVKFRGPCQAASSQLSVISSQPSVVTDPAICNLRTEMAVRCADRPSRGSAGARESQRGQSIDSTMVVLQAAQSKKPGRAESKALTSHTSDGRRTVLSGFAGRPKCGESDLLIPKWLMPKLPRRTGEGLLNLKGLLTVLTPSGRATFSGLVGRRKCGALYLLVLKGLLAKLLRRSDEALLNLKGLLAVFPPSLKRFFDNEPVLRPLFCAESHQILPFSNKNVQIAAEKKGFFAA